MPLLRLAYSALYLVALVAVYIAWAQVGGQSHLDLLPWHWKLVLGAAMALTIVRATSAAVAGERGWNGQSLRWLGLTLALGIGCGLASYYAHVYLEEDEDQGDEEQSEATVSRLGFFPNREVLLARPSERSSDVCIWILIPSSPETQPRSPVLLRVSPSIAEAAADRRSTHSNPSRT
jgi:hypothetical protein